MSAFVDGLVSDTQREIARLSQCAAQYEFLNGMGSPVAAEYRAKAQGLQNCLERGRKTTNQYGEASEVPDSFFSLSLSQATPDASRANPGVAPQQEITSAVHRPDGAPTDGDEEAQAQAHRMGERSRTVPVRFVGEPGNGPHRPEHESRSPGVVVVAGAEKCGTNEMPGSMQDMPSGKNSVTVSRPRPRDTEPVQARMPMRTVYEGPNPVQHGFATSQAKSRKEHDGPRRSETSSGIVAPVIDEDKAWPQGRHGVVAQRASAHRGESTGQDPEVAGASPADPTTPEAPDGPPVAGEGAVQSLNGAGAVASTSSAHRSRGSVRACGPEGAGIGTPPTKAGADAPDNDLSAPNRVDSGTNHAAAIDAAEAAPKGPSIGLEEKRGSTVDADRAPGSGPRAVSGMTAEPETVEHPIVAVPTASATAVVVRAAAVGAPPAFGTPAWHAWRRTVLGASEIAAVVGLSPHATALDVFNEKMGITTRETSPAMRQGLAFEATIATMLQEDHPDWVLEGDGRTTFVLHGDPLFVASPDRFVMDEPRRSGLEIHRAVALLQIKGTAAYIEDWGEPGTDQVPKGHLCQVTQEMAVVGVPVCHVARFVWGKPIAAYRVAFDPELWAMLREDGARFMRDHVLTGKPPAMDGTDAGWAYLAARYKKAGEALRTATDEEAALVARYDALRAQIKAHEAEKDEVAQRLCQGIGGDLGLTTPAHTFKWLAYAESHVEAYTRKAGRKIDCRPRKCK